MGPTVLLEGACTSEQASSWCLKVVCVCVCVCVCACVGVGMGVRVHPVHQGTSYTGGDHGLQPSRNAGGFLVIPSHPPPS